MMRIAVLVVALAGCKGSAENKPAEAQPAPAPVPATAPAPAAEPAPAPEAPPAAPAVSAEDAAMIEKARALETRAVFPKPVAKPFVAMQDKLIDYVSKVASNPSPAVSVGACKTASKARCVFIDAPCTGGCDVNGMSVWLRIDGETLALDHAMLGDISITSEADIDAVYREIDGE